MENYLDKLGISGKYKGCKYLAEAYKLACSGMNASPAMILEVGEKFGVRYIVVRKALCRVCDMIAIREPKMQMSGCKDLFPFMKKLFFVVRDIHNSPDFQ